MLNSSMGVCSSRRGPLWIAAFCLKKLKKAQVFDTDISSSVDKILHDEMDVVSYRVLAYLLLGVVRIYSKKVEYLFHDCNDVLVRINKFVIKTKVNAPVKTLRMSITIPDSFELDALDLDILEDAGGDHIASPEEITLKEVLCNAEGLEQFSQEKFEDFDFGGSSYSSDHLMAQDVHQSHLMDMDFEVFPSNSPINLLASKDTSQNSIFSQEEPMNFDPILVVEGIEKESANLFGQDQQINEDQTVQKIAPYEDEIHGESRISQEESMDTSVFSGKEKEAVLPVEACNEYCQVDNEHNMAKEASSSLCQTHHEIVEVNESRNFQESIESVHNDKSSVVKESLEELIGGSIEQHDKEGKLEFQEKGSLEDGKSSVIPAESKNLDVTPQSRFRGGSIGRRKPGAAPPEFMAISTPAARERAHFSRKRKFVVDEMIVLPNEVLRKSLHDASDLISNRKKNRCTLLTIQRESHISGLPDGFYESLLPCYSSELQSLFSKKTLKIPDSLKIVETLQKLDVSKSQIVGSPEHIETAPQTPPRFPGSLVYGETRGKVVAFESQSSGSPDHIATAPETPPLCQNVKAQSMKHPERTEIHDKDNLGPSNPHERREREQSLEMNDNLIEEFNAETLNPHESLEREQFFTMDEDLNLMNEEINSCDTENSKLLAGWSERTRKVARCLHKNFLDLRKQRKGDVVNFSQVTKGRTRKECARLFHEILVLRTTSHVDVQQNNAYDDIAISKLPKFDQTFGVDATNKSELSYPSDATDAFPLSSSLCFHLPLRSGQFFLKWPSKEASSSLCQTHHEIVEVNESRNFQESIESVHNDKSSVVKESLEELIGGSIEQHDKEGKLEFQEKGSLEDGKSSVIPAESKNLDVTPQSRFRGGSIGRRKPGAAPPEFMAISTPAARERAHFSRKRKFVVDEMIVLPNEVLRKSLHDASDLISNRKKNRCTLLTIQRESHISGLPDGFYESLLPCYSSELQSLFSKKTLKIPDSLKIVETLQKLDVSKSQIVGSPEHIETAPQTPPRFPGSLVYGETRGKVVAFESQSSGSPDHIATAPETPPLCQNVKAQSMKHPERTEIHDKDNLGPSNPHERREREQSLEMNDNLIEEFNAETLNPHESLEREQFFTMDEDLNLMNEEINSCDTENSKLLAGWSERTRKVARCLHKNFLDLRKQRKGDVVNFSQVTKGRTRKECARLFHEILVLRTTSHVDVQQNNAYDDIAISKLPKFDQTFGVDGLF